MQKGSLVAADKLRFDFAHYAALSGAQVTEIEQRVNAQIRANEPALTRVMNYEAAVGTGAMALLGKSTGTKSGC